MANFVLDIFNSADWLSITARNGEIGATWLTHSAGNAGTFHIFNKHVYPTVFGATYASGIPPTPEYNVECDYKVVTNIGHLGPAGRLQTNADTYYYTYFNSVESRWVLAKRVNGVVTSLGTFNQTISNGTTLKVRLELKNSTKKVFINDVERISSTDNAITAAGRAGIQTANSFAYNTGKQITNFRAFDDIVAARPSSQTVGMIGI